VLGYQKLQRVVLPMPVWRCCTYILDTVWHEDGMEACASASLGICISRVGRFGDFAGKGPTPQQTRDGSTTDLVLEEERSWQSVAAAERD
jgi:hypothetical protein